MFFQTSKKEIIVIINCFCSILCKYLMMNSYAFIFFIIKFFDEINIIFSKIADLDSCFTFLISFNLNVSDFINVSLI